MSELRDIIQRLAWEMDSWKSVEIRTLAEFTNSFATVQNGMWPSGRHERTYIETSEGHRFLEHLTAPANQPEQLTAFYGDGLRCANVTFASGRGSLQTHVMIKKSFGEEGRIGGTSRPTPLRYLYVGQVPLHEALPGATPLGAHSHLGRECDAFLFRRVKLAYVPLDLVYCLDRETSIPLEVTAFDDDQARREERPCFAWRAQSLDRVEEHYLPLRSEEIDYTKTLWPDPLSPRGQSPKAMVTTKIEVQAIQFDREHPQALFWPVIEPQASVLDTINPIPRRNHPADRSQAPATQATTIDPIRAEVPGHGASYLPAAGLGLGTVFLLVAIGLKLRAVFHR